MRLLAPKKRAVDQCVAATGFSRAKIYRWIKQGKLIWEPVKRPGGDRWRLKLTCVGKSNSDRIPTWRRFNRACDRHGLDPGRVLAAILLGAVTEAIDVDYVFVDVDKVAAGRLRGIVFRLAGGQTRSPWRILSRLAGRENPHARGHDACPGDVRQPDRKESALFRITVSLDQAEFPARLFDVLSRARSVQLSR